MVWEQELYNQMIYSSPKPYFHTFAADVSELLQHCYIVKTFIVFNIKCCSFPKCRTVRSD